MTNLRNVHKKAPLIFGVNSKTSGIVQIFGNNVNKSKFE
jgi:hypothetical protein